MNIQPRIPLDPAVFDHRNLREPFNKALIARLTLDPRSFRMELGLMQTYGATYMFHYYVCVALNFAHPLQHGNLSAASAILKYLEMLFQNHVWERAAILDIKFVLAKCYVWHQPGVTLLRLAELYNVGYEHDEFSGLFWHAYQAVQEAA